MNEKYAAVSSLTGSKLLLQSSLHTIEMSRSVTVLATEYSLCVFVN